MKRVLFFSGLLLLSSSCKEKWNEEDKRAFYTACTEEARKSWAPSDSMARAYCDCVFGKMSLKYPDEEDLLEHIDKLAKDTDLMKCREEVSPGK